MTTTLIVFIIGKDTWFQHAPSCSGLLLGQRTGIPSLLTLLSCGFEKAYLLLLLARFATLFSGLITKRCSKLMKNSNMVISEYLGKHGVLWTRDPMRPYRHTHGTYPTFLLWCVHVYACVCVCVCVWHGFAWHIMLSGLCIWNTIIDREGQGPGPAPCRNHC